MSGNKVSVLVVDERPEVRNCLWELLRDQCTEVSVAENSRDAFGYFPELAREIWPDIMILGQGTQHQGAKEIVGEVRNSRRDIFARTSIIVFPAFQAGGNGARPVSAESPQFCRMSTLANLITVVCGLTKKKLAPSDLV